MTAICAKRPTGESGPMGFDPRASGVQDTHLPQAALALRRREAASKAWAELGEGDASDALTALRTEAFFKAPLIGAPQNEGCADFRPQPLRPNTFGGASGDITFSAGSVISADRRPPMKLADPTLLKHQCLIDGAWVGEGVDAIHSPATGALIAKVPRFGHSETVRAIEAAEKAFGPWAKTLPKERAKILRRWFDLIIANRDDVALIMTSEQGKPLAEARGEVDYAAGFIEFFGEEAKRIYGEINPTFRADSRIVVLKQPIGVVAAITPWNFPAAMITRKLAPALAVGCTAVAKPAPETPLTALALGELALRAGVPAGVLNLLTGDAPAIGKVMCEHAAVRFVGFTGSTEVGKLLMRQAAGTVKKVGLELGGNAPFIVFDDADVEAAVEGAIVSKFRNMGQTCVCANRIYAQDKIYDAFVAKLTEAVAKLNVGDGTAPGSRKGRSSTRRRWKRSRRMSPTRSKRAPRRRSAASATSWGAPSSSRRCSLG